MQYKRKLVYQDKEFADSLEIELADARVAAQNALDIWNGLGVGVLKHPLFQLVHDPQTVYHQTVTKDETPRSREKLTPCPNEIYVACRLARRASTHLGRPDLMSIENDTTVVINEAEKERLVHINDIYAENEAQEQFIIDVAKYVELSNSISKTLMELPTDRMPAVPFSVTGRFFPIISRLKLEVEYLAEIVKAL